MGMQADGWAARPRQPRSCTNAYPDTTERAQVDSLWANGLATALKPASRG
ncbi:MULTISPECIES: hypothetical protein [unclassified Streptomyces]